jgi:hypothetical protein
MMADEAKAAADKKLAEDKKKIAADNEARAKFYADRAKHLGRPTPTQEECDLIRLGNHIELSPDGSPPDPWNTGQSKESAAANHGGGGYAHRQSTARHGGASTGSSS